MVDGKISPRGTPHWDALARVPLASEGAVMIEAKAHRGELVKPNDSSKADKDSLNKIRKSFGVVRDYYGVAETVSPWESRYYQVCNRLAHLYWMNVRAKVPTWLVWVFIVNDPVWIDAMTALSGTRRSRRSRRRLACRRNIRLWSGSAWSTCRRLRQRLIPRRHLRLTRRADPSHARRDLGMRIRLSGRPDQYHAS